MKPEGVVLHPLASADAPDLELMCILGTGDFRCSLGLRLLHCGPLVMTHAEAARSAKLTFVCVHRQRCEFLEKMAPQLEGKVLVDLSDNLKKDIYMEASAAYLNEESLIHKYTVSLCGNNEEAKRAVAEMATKLGLIVVDKESLSAARELENFPLWLFPERRVPLCKAVSLTAFFVFCLLIRGVIYAYVEKDQEISYCIMISLANKVFPVVSLVTQSLCYLPGAMAGLLQLYIRTQYRRFPHWLDRWMLCRKHPAFLSFFQKNNKTTLFDFGTTEAWGTDSFYVLGILGFLVFVLLGLTSSVGGTLRWREFNFIQVSSQIKMHSPSYVCVHTFTYKWYTPPSYMLYLIVPSVTLVLKLWSSSFTVWTICCERTWPNEEPFGHQPLNSGC
uniref:STEAP family member 4 n=1 Tax=Amphilophus citrinellus TaxID=61819 RepID=A0A3Q0S0R0_AMPCI